MREQIEEMQKKRFQFLLRSYELSQGDRHKSLNALDIGRKLDLDEKESWLIYDYLVEEGLIKGRTAGGFFSIAHWGIKQIEAALSAPEAATEYFPPVVNIITAEQIIDSQIQQAGSDATQLVLREGKQKELTQLIESLSKSLDELGLDDQYKSDLRAEILTMEAQASKSKPNRAIITESLKSALRILEEAAGGALAVGFIELIKGLLGG